MELHVRGQSSPRLQATVVSTLSAFVSKHFFAAKMQMQFQTQNLMDDPYGPWQYIEYTLYTQRVYRYTM